MWSIVTFSLAQATDLPGWSAVGPERGHVMDIGVRKGQIIALSRIGAFAAPLDLSEWKRFPHFPVNARAFSFVRDSENVWSISPNGVFFHSPAPAGIAPAPLGGMFLDIEAAESGSALTLVRGAETVAGVWRVAQDGTMIHGLSGVDPWVIAVRENVVYVGTIGQGLWVSHDFGKSFTNLIPEGTVSAADWIGDTPWFGWVDGRITKGESQTLECTLPKAVPTAISRVAGQIYAFADEEARPYFDIFRCEADGTASAVRPAVRDPDQTSFSPTGLWPVDADRALVGTFRSGPFLLDATGLRAARTGFRATIGAAAAARDEELSVSMMSTGVYRTVDEGKSWAIPGVKGLNFPVTDTSDLLYLGSELVALDFEGLRILRDRDWVGEAGKKIQNTLRSNDLTELSFDAKNQLWAKDFQGGLWARVGAEWQSCPSPKVARLEGQGQGLLIATETGFVRAKQCEGPFEPAWMGQAGESKSTLSRADGDWLASPGTLYFRGNPVASLAEAKIQAISVYHSAQGDEFVLIAAEDVPVQHCDTDGCQPVALPPPSPIRALGMLTSGGIWALENRGTMLLSRPGERGDDLPSLAQYLMIPGFKHVEQSEFSSQMALNNLEHPPWRGAVAGADPQSKTREAQDALSVAKRAAAAAEDLPPETDTSSSGVWRWIIAAEAAVLAGAIAFFSRERSAKSTGRSRR